jgi:hypothetical protein
VAVGNGAVEHGARLLGATEGVCHGASIEQEPVVSELRKRTEETARSALGDEDFTRAMDDGRNLDLAKAAAAALEGVTS